MYELLDSLPKMWAKDIELRKKMITKILSHCENEVVEETKTVADVV